MPFGRNREIARRRLLEIELERQERAAELDRAAAWTHLIETERHRTQVVPNSPQELHPDHWMYSNDRWQFLSDQQMAPPPGSLGELRATGPGSVVPMENSRGQTVTLDQYEALRNSIVQQPRNGLRQHPTTYLDILDENGDIEWGKFGSVPVGRANELLVQAFNNLQHRIRILEAAANAPQTRSTTSPR